MYGVEIGCFDGVVFVVSVNILFLNFVVVEVILFFINFGFMQDDMVNFFGNVVNYDFVFSKLFVCLFRVILGFCCG